MKGKKLSIDIERCKGCGLCVFYCPKKCLKLAEVFNKTGNHFIELTMEDVCNGCGTCYIMCPDYAVEIKER